MKKDLAFMEVEAVHKFLTANDFTTPREDEMMRYVGKDGCEYYLVFNIKARIPYPIFRAMECEVITYQPL